MKTISSYLLVGILLLGAASCTNSEFKKTKSGLLYKIYTDGKGPVAQKGQFLKSNIIEKLRDSTLFTTYGSVPQYLHVDSPKGRYSPDEIFSTLRKGDSAVVVLLVDTLQRQSGGQLPAFLKKKDKIIVTFKITDLFASQDLVLADRQQEMNKQNVKEIKLVEDYLHAHNIQAQKTQLGTYYVIQTPGDGPAVDSGKQVSIRYTGRALPGDKVFESNMTGPGNEPFKFVVGAHQVIPGWDDALKNFKKGGKGTLYIPAFLAYNDRPMPGHPPFESLAFDIEVVDVTDAPPPSANPGMPGLPPGAGGGRPQFRPQIRPQGAQPQQPQPQQQH
jgi:FKBP-type peptidyl-prolyl cis-trans isomerase FkpA